MDPQKNVSKSVSRKTKKPKKAVIESTVYGQPVIHSIEIDSEVDDFITPENLASLSPETQRKIEESKRQHHLVCEQARRKTIKDALEQLKATIPSYENQKMTKANILNKSISYVHFLKRKTDLLAQENHQLRETLEVMKKDCHCGAANRIYLFPSRVSETWNEFENLDISGKDSTPSQQNHQGYYSHEVEDFKDIKPIISRPNQHDIEPQQHSQQNIQYNGNPHTYNNSYVQNYHVDAQPFPDSLINGTSHIPMYINNVPQPATFTSNEMKQDSVETPNSSPSKKEKSNKSRNSDSLTKNRKKKKKSQNLVEVQNQMNQQEIEHQNSLSTPHSEVNTPTALLNEFDTSNGSLSFQNYPTNSNSYSNFSELSLPKNWELVCFPDGDPAYFFDKVSRRGTFGHPTNHIVLEPTVRELPLPQGYEIARSLDSSLPVFVDHVTRTTSWVDPRPPVESSGNDYWDPVPISITGSPLNDFMQFEEDFCLNTGRHFKDEGYHSRQTSNETEDDLFLDGLPSYYQLYQ